MQNLRRVGPEALDTYLRSYGASASPMLDRVCAQKDAHTSLLYWHTDQGAALVDARRTKRPILSLRLLGRLDEELSCANSRFFRKLLYPDTQINRVLREQFVLHWESVRPVPIVTIDFGGGRRVERTLTGNSAHLVLDWRARPVDVLPGLFDRETFLVLLAQAQVYAKADRGDLAHLHRDALRPVLPPVAPSRAFAASRIAPTKHTMEAPLLRAVQVEADADTRENLTLHDRVHEAFAAGAEWAGIPGLVEWIYAELFAMPLGDPALGLDIPDPFPIRATA
ncbi:MAG TPA: hypothetical protein VFV99_21425 [Kofleriaceae bacterium]|nr:hypothetical protein [Kofleriaceae bacterium]